MLHSFCIFGLDLSLVLLQCEAIVYLYLHWILDSHLQDNMSETEVIISHHPKDYILSLMVCILLRPCIYTNQKLEHLINVFLIFHILINYQSPNFIGFTVYTYSASPHFSLFPLWMPEVMFLATLLLSDTYKIYVTPITSLTQITAATSKLVCRPLLSFFILSCFSHCSQNNG